MTRRAEIGLRIAALTSFSIGSGTGLARALDLAIARDSRGDPYIPASSLKGALRQAGREILRVIAHSSPDGGTAHHCLDRPSPCRGPFCPLCVCFGSPRREALFRVRDARLAPLLAARDRRDLADPFRWASPRTRVSTDRRLGRATQGLLFSREYADAGLVFETVIEGRGRFRDPSALADSPVPPEVTFVVACARLVDRFGGGTGHGAGAVRVEVTSLALDGTRYSATLDDLLNEEAFEIVLADLWNDLGGAE